MNPCLKSPSAWLVLVSLLLNGVYWQLAKGFPESRYHAHRIQPSHQENFGIVIAEALAVGCPVIISNAVNIWREIVEDGAGLAGPDTVQDTADNIERFLRLSFLQKEEMRQRAKLCYQARFSVAGVAAEVFTAISEAV